MLAERPPTQEVGYTHRDPFGIQYPTGTAFQQGIVQGTPRNPVIRSSGPLHPALKAQATPKSLQTPFVPVPYAAHQSVPDLAPDIGRLQVANHMPGDVSSGDEGGSRANSREGGEPSRAQATPMQVYNRDNGVLMNVPLTPAHPAIQVTRAISESDEPPLPLPGQTRRMSLSHNWDRPAGWAASIRSNLAHAFNTVVGAQPSTSSTDELLTRRGDEALSTSRGESGDASSFGKLAYGGLEVPAVCFDEVSESAKDWDDLSAWMTNQKFTPVPSSHSAVIPPNASGTPVPAALFKRTPRASNGALPQATPVQPPLCRSTTTESVQGAKDRRRDLNALRRSRKSSKRDSAKLHRPTLAGKLSSLSVGSEMSRVSSASSALNEQEKFARRALRERRRRVLEMSGRGLDSGRRGRSALASPAPSFLPIHVDKNKT
ncbi:hypothetical protein EIP91_003030 [Steccherinum ochraceum]|uniref:Uncharacterized protein n=1 Tax=Steccherinum ochraceum TaxID=92696 RepID=A0A4R0RRT8_9APHY|nr:hypothetical protein EIP91_003030 [Steccherinum ochraceum]